METLSKIFGSETKVKIMRLFLFNPEKVFDTQGVADRVKALMPKVRRELGTLEKMGLIKKRGSREKLVRGGKKGFMLNPQFTYLSSLQNFLINVEPLQPKEIVHRLTRLGSIKLIIIAGVFIQENESRVDLLVVGDGVKKAALEHVVQTLESEIGKELRYAYFTTADFQYRISMYDKLTRDILDYPHRKILNKLGSI